MGIEIKDTITATCEKCGKQERIKEEIDGNLVKLPDGWINVTCVLSGQHIFCEECHNKEHETESVLWSTLNVVVLRMNDEIYGGKYHDKNIY